MIIRHRGRPSTSGGQRLQPPSSQAPTSARRGPCRIADHEDAPFIACRRSKRCIQCESAQGMPLVPIRSTSSQPRTTRTIAVAIVAFARQSRGVRFGETGIAMHKATCHRRCRIADTGELVARLPYGFSMCVQMVTCLCCGCALSAGSRRPQRSSITCLWDTVGSVRHHGLCTFCKACNAACRRSGAAAAPT